MKFEPDTPVNVNVITRHEAARVWIGSRAIERSVLVPWRGELQDWPLARFEALSADHFDRIAALEPEVVVFGSGARLRFPSPALLVSLMSRRIGIETMDNAAACRTYNVLASEGRRVVAALLIETAPEMSGAATDDAPSN
ncbi:MAG: Mth938-like domain-containing protein [Rubrivivax sp.]